MEDSMKGLDSDVFNFLEDTIAGGVVPQPVPNGGVVLTLSARKVIHGYLQAKVDEINAAEGDEQQRLIDALPPMFCDALKIGQP
jgi:hypothetical protein